MCSIPTHDLMCPACFVTFPSSEGLASAHAPGSATSGAVPYQLKLSEMGKIVDTECGKPG